MIENGRWQLLGMQSINTVWESFLKDFSLFKELAASSSLDTATYVNK